MIDIFSLSVEEMASKIKDGQLTSVEVCEKYIERTNKFEKDIKACLLYTSPSPRDRTRSRMPSSA